MGYTRVKDPVTGHEYSTLVVVDGLKVLEKPGADANGQPFPPKHNRPLSSLASSDGVKVSAMTKPQLLDYAAASGIVLEDEAPSKDAILAAIAADEGDDYVSEPAPGDGDEGTTPAS